MRVAVLCVIVAGCGRIGFRARDDGGGGSANSDGDGIRIGDGSRPDIVFSSNVVFVTGQVATPSSFGTLGAADAICQKAADDASLPGTYIAWLSTTTTNAIDRLAGARGWVRTDGIAFADQPSDIAAGNVWSPISLSADGSSQAFADPLVVTGTTATGTATANCSDWSTSASVSAQLGLLTTNDATWTASTTSTSVCAGPARLYCFGTGNQVAVAPPTVTGRRAFYTRPLALGGGISALDLRCQTEADAASLGGTFHAFVATASASAISRFDTTKARWERLDGVPLAPTAADLAVGLHAALDTYADGTLYAVPFGAAKAWTGAVNPTFVAVGDSACTDWTATAPSQAGFWGQPSGAAGPAFHNGMRRCDDSNYGIYCLEL